MISQSAGYRRPERAERSATFDCIPYASTSRKFIAWVKANGFDPGDEFRLDGSLQYRLWPKTLGDAVPSFHYGVLETNLVNRDKNEINGEDSNSGGTTVYLSPGLQYVTKRWIAEGVVQLPLIQNQNGSALENDYVVRAGIRLNF